LHQKGTYSSQSNLFYSKTSCTLNAKSNLLTVTDAKSQQTVYTYSNMNRTSTRQDPLLNTETYTYDNNGNLTTVTDRKSQVTTNTYDALNRRTCQPIGDRSCNHTANPKSVIVDSTRGGRLCEPELKPSAKPVFRGEDAGKGLFESQCPRLFLLRRDREPHRAHQAHLVDFLTGMDFYFILAGGPPSVRR
jgi:YD repeat-containing protein